MYSVVYPESGFGEFSGMVPEWFRNAILVDFPEWFRNGSGMQFWWIFRNGSGMVPETFHVSPQDIFDEDPIPSALSVKIGVALSVVLSSYVGGPCKCLKEYVAFLHNTFLGFSGKCMYSFRRQLFNRVNICNRRHNLALGYGGDRIWICGCW